MILIDEGQDKNLFKGPVKVVPTPLAHMLDLSKINKSSKRFPLTQEFFLGRNQRSTKQGRRITDIFDEIPE